MSDQVTDKVNEPYPGIDDPETIAKIDSCVTQVMDSEGLDKPSAIAVCMSSVVEGKPLDEAVMTFRKSLDTPVDATLGEADYPWDQCIADQLDRYGDEETAKKVCGMIKKKYGGSPIELPSASEFSAFLAGVEKELNISPKNSVATHEAFFPALAKYKRTLRMSEAATVKNKVRAAIRALDELLEEKELPEALRMAVKDIREKFKSKTWADLAAEIPESERAAESAEHFAESYGGVTQIVEAAQVDPARAPLTMQVRLIRPGFGNSTDNHYYSPEVLKAAAPLFVGKKMYTTNHVAGEKSVNTEVSVIEKVESYDSDGSPIASVKVFDPSFAEKVRNMQTAGQLDKLECSVLGTGTAKPFEMDGRKGKMVESITDIESVDWVTRAGAGGGALAIAENQPPKTEGVLMTDQGKQIEVTNTTPVTDPAPVAEAATTTAPAAKVTLSETQVTALLEAEKRLPDVSRVRLAEGQYNDSDAVQAAITKELAYLKDILGSGQPFGLGAPQVKPKKTYEEQLAEAHAALDRVNDKYLHGGKK